MNKPQELFELPGDTRNSLEELLNNEFSLALVDIWNYICSIFDALNYLNDVTRIEIRALIDSYGYILQRANLLGEANIVLSGPGGVRIPEGINRSLQILSEYRTNLQDYQQINGETGATPFLKLEDFYLILIKSISTLARIIMTAELISQKNHNIASSVNAVERRAALDESSKVNTALGLSITVTSTPPNGDFTGSHTIQIEGDTIRMQHKLVKLVKGINMAVRTSSGLVPISSLPQLFVDFFEGLAEEEP